MDLILSNFTEVDYVVITTYEDGHRAYSVPQAQKETAGDYKKNLELGLFGPSKFGRVRSIIVVERTTTVKEKILD